MPRNKIILALAVLIALLPILGFPHKWEAFFQIFAGLSIVGLSVWTTIDRRLTIKAKAHKRQAQKRKIFDMEHKKEGPVTPVEQEWLEVTEGDIDTSSL
jgi:hypothetical protein